MMDLQGQNIKVMEDPGHWERLPRLGSSFNWVAWAAAGPEDRPSSGVHGMVCSNIRKA